MKNLTKITIIWCVLAAALLNSCADSNGPGNNSSGKNQGTKFTVNSQECTWVFKANGNYEVIGYGIVGTKTGTWSAKGNDITISYASSGHAGCPRRVSVTFWAADKNLLQSHIYMLIASLFFGQFTFSVYCFMSIISLWSIIFSFLKYRPFGLYIF